MISEVPFCSRIRCIVSCEKVSMRYRGGTYDVESDSTGFNTKAVVTAHLWAKELNSQKLRFLV